MSETIIDEPPTENLPRPIDLAYLEFVDRKASWAEASDRLDSGLSPVGTTFDVDSFDSDPEAKAHRRIPVRPPPLTCYMPYQRPIAAIVPVPRKPESEYDENDGLPVLEDILSNISDLPDLEEVIEITIEHDLEDFASDTEEMPPLEDVPYGEFPQNNEPIRQEESQYVQDQHLAEFEYFADPINALERF